ncbi:hypothetical protein C8N35_102121 [Breoghania corrubedonensis]|uniref:Uncharacterized protein n=1 Tax=Breoghania corrubedonensis TaxID=665038 RepID=A0A2T5VCE2_9HYPH|nr:hypothetical protein [Breoghania corrubedonensis]PTW61412.1 hypothetical protein C8N35_102121 [Breoghania corrubedonensis]
MKGYRTTLINGAVALVPIAAELLKFLGAFDWQAYLEPRDALWAMLIIGGLNIFLRRITSTPIGRSS